METNTNQGGRRKAGRAKGTGSLERHGRTWRAVWWVNGKRFMRSTGTPDKREAEKRLAEFVAPYRLTMEADKESNAAKTADSAGMGTATISVLSESARMKAAAAARLLLPISFAWKTFNSSMQRKPPSAATSRMYECRWNTFRAWLEKNRPHVVGVADVDAGTADAFMREIRAKFSPKTFNDYRFLLMQMWKVLDVAAGLEGFNPWRDVAPMDRETHSRRELTAEELMRVVEPLEGEMRVLFAIGIYTGLRMGDAVNLSWGAVDLVRGFIQCTPSKTRKHNTKVKIPLFPRLASILAETPPRARKGLILPGLAEEYRRSNFYTSERVRKAFVAAGIETQGSTGRTNTKTKTERKAVEVGFHSLRHTFVSLCGNAGVPLHIVQEIVGHTNEAMTQHYFHVSDSALKGAVADLPDVFSAKALPPHTDAANESVTELEAVPADVAEVARMLTAATPKQRKAIEAILRKGGAK